MRDLNTLNDSALLRKHSRLVAADLAERAKPPRVRQPVHAMCLAMSEVYQLEPAVTLIGVDMAKPGSDQTAVTLIAPSAPAATDVWHTEAPTVAGDYLCRIGRSPYEFVRNYNGARWSTDWIQGASDSAAKSARKIKASAPQNTIQWFRLISADTPPIADWRPGDQVLKLQPIGLWHVKRPGDSAVGAARDISRLVVLSSLLYRPAAPGVREGEAYDEARYGVAG